jgi:putative ABC transport system permease protein
MIVSVTEYREIVKVLGAKRIVLSIFLSKRYHRSNGRINRNYIGINWFWDSLGDGLCFVIPWTAILAAFLTSFMVAIISGLYLQLKPQTVDPIEALRYE